MTDSEKTLARRWVHTWMEAGPELQKIRDADIRAADTAEALRIFTGSADWAAKNRPPAPSSGLVEQQRWFMKLASHE